MDFAQLAAAWGLAGAQPLVTALRNSLLESAGWSAAEAIVFGIGVVFLPPLALLALERIVGRIVPRAQWPLHIGLVSAMAGIFAAYRAKSGHPDSGELIVAAACGAAAVVALAMWRLQWARGFIAALVLLPVLTIGQLALDPPNRGLTFSDDLVLANPPADGPPVVLLLFDELPTASLLDGTGRLDTRRLPNFARLARQATWYRSAFTVADQTRTALPAVLTGRRVDPTSGDSPRETIFTLLGRHYRMNVHEHLDAAHLCHPTLCPSEPLSGFPKRTADLLPTVGRVWLNQWVPNPVLDRLDLSPSFGAPYSPGEHRALERGIRRRDRKPALHYLHSMLPHLPWSVLPTGQRYGAGLPLEVAIPGTVRDPTTGFVAITRNDTLSRDRPVARQVLQAALAQTSAADLELGRLLNRLQETDQWERSLVIVVADHGASFTPGRPFRRLIRSNAAALLGVPLFVKLPYQRTGRLDRHFVRNVDVLPTIAKVTGTKAQGRLDGAPLTGNDVRRRRAPEAYSTLTDRDLTYRPATLLRGQRVLARRQAQLFGPDTPSLELFDFGPARALLGRRVSELPRNLARVPVELSTDVSAVDPRGPFVPASISGSVPNLRPGQALAVALNGRIAASTWTHESDGRMRFAALVPSRLFRRGQNSVQVFAPRPATR